MKAIYYLAFLCLALIGCNSSKEEKRPSDVITYSLQEDGRSWKVGHEDQNAQASITEYVLDNENTQNWTELVTVHYFKDLEVTPKTYWGLFVEELKKNAGGHKVETKIINEEPNSLFGEWWIQDGANTDQHEWIRIFTKGRDLAILRYTTKNMKDVEANRKKWEHIISSAKF